MTKHRPSIQIEPLYTARYDHLGADFPHDIHRAQSVTLKGQLWEVYLGPPVPVLTLRNQIQISLSTVQISILSKQTFLTHLASVIRFLSKTVISTAKIPYIDSRNTRQYYKLLLLNKPLTLFRHIMVLFELLTRLPRVLYICGYVDNFRNQYLFTHIPNLNIHSYLRTPELSLALLATGAYNRIEALGDMDRVSVLLLLGPSYTQRSNVDLALESFEYQNFIA